jgi:DnaJ homolog subfamily C member 19
MIRFILIIVLLGGLYILLRRALAPSKAMTAAEAAKVLDIPQTASAEMIIAAHKRLIAKVHPDAGGSDELAARVNQARDCLLRLLPK